MMLAAHGVLLFQALWALERVMDLNLVVNPCVLVCMLVDTVLGGR